MNPIRRLWAALSRKPSSQQVEIKPSWSLSSLAMSYSLTKMESAKPPQVRPEYELFYRKDATVFGIVNRLSRDIATVPFLAQAQDDSIREQFQEWLNNVDFGRVFRDITQDVLVYGNAWLELIPNKANTDIVRLKRIDPLTMDFERDEQGNIVVDEWGKPVHVIQTVMGVQSEPIEKERIAHFKINDLPHDFLGMSPLEPLYQIMKYKLNIENALAEGVWRLSFPPILVTAGDDAHPPTPENLEALKTEFKDLDKKLALFLPPWVKVARLDVGMGRAVIKIENILAYLNNLIKEAYGLPPETKKGGEEVPDYEKTVERYRMILIEQFEEEVFKQLAIKRDWAEVPTVAFPEVEPRTKLFNTRAVGYLRRSGLLTWDPEVENYFRKMFGIPPIGKLKEEEQKLKKEEAEHYRKLTMEGEA